MTKIILAKCIANRFLFSPLNSLKKRFSRDALEFLEKKHIKLSFSDNSNSYELYADFERDEDLVEFMLLYREIVPTIIAAHKVIADEIIGDLPP